MRHKRGREQGMSRSHLLSALMLAFCLFGAKVAHADALAVVPPSQGRITDTVHLLSTSEVASLTTLLADYERETHHQIAVLIVPTTGGETIESFSLRVAKAWQPGLANWNDGILVTLATQDHHIRIEVGTGMEQYISNATAQAIIDKAMVPAFRKGDFAGGLRAGLLPLMDDARKFQIRDQTPSLETAQTSNPWCTRLTAQVASNVLHGPAQFVIESRGFCTWERVGDPAAKIQFKVEENVTSFGVNDRVPHEIVKDVGESAFWYSSESGFHLLEAYAKHTKVVVWIYVHSGLPINDRSGCAAIATDILRQL
jgi:uncharacterized membrane protein YgcG